MSNYYKNRERSYTVNNEPSMTDQSQAAETDLNVIIRQFMKTGQATGPADEPMYGDFTEIPTDLRGMIELGRDLKRIRSQLPKEIRDTPVEELLSMHPEAIKAILEPATTPVTPKEEPK